MNAANFSLRIRRCRWSVPRWATPSRAPAGYATVKIEGSLPYALREGPQHWDNIKEQVAEKILARLQRVAPNLTSNKVLGKFLESPIDIERMNPAMWRGSVHHGDRRIPQLVNYKMPIPGLYQTGACTPPGGLDHGNARAQRGGRAAEGFGNQH